MRLLVMVIAAVSSMGCLSASTMGLARTLNKGAVQGWASAAGGGIIASAPTASTGGVPTTTSTGTGYPMVEGGVRVGVSDHVELGGRLGFNGIGIEGKFGFVRSPTMDSGINVSLAPQVGFVGIGVAGAFVGVVTMQLPVLIGIDFGGHELVLGPKLHNSIYFAGVSAGGSSANAVIDLLSAGASVGFAIKAGPVRLLPEVSFVVPFFASAGASASGTSGAVASGVGVGGFAFQIGFGILFGSSESYERAEEPIVSPPPMPAPAPVPMPIPADGPPPPPPPSN